MKGYIPWSLDRKHMGLFMKDRVSLAWSQTICKGVGSAQAGTLQDAVSWSC